MSDLETPCIAEAMALRETGSLSTSIGLVTVAARDAMLTAIPIGRGDHPLPPHSTLVKLAVEQSRAYVRRAEPSSHFRCPG